MWSILQLTDLDTDAATHRLVFTQTRTFLLLPVFLRREGQGNIPIRLVAVLLSRYQSPPIQLQHFCFDAHVKLAGAFFIYYTRCLVFSSLKAFLQFLYR